MIERILVVDDDQSLREFLTITLSRDGFEVVAAASGPEALKAMAEAPADLALVDLKMPGMDGLEVLRRLKEISETVAVVIVTAFATTETAIQALKEGAYDYLVKPFELDEVGLLLERLLELRSLRRENRELRRALETPALLESSNAAMRPSTEGSLVNSPSALLWKYGAVAHIATSEGVRW